jgi:hypothetical protein
MISLSAKGPIIEAHLGRATDFAWPEGAWFFVRRELSPLRPTAVLGAVLGPAAVALLPLLHNAVAAQGRLRF